MNYKLNFLQPNVLQSLTTYGFTRKQHNILGKKVRSFSILIEFVLSGCRKKQHLFVPFNNILKGHFYTNECVRFMNPFLHNLHVVHIFFKTSLLESGKLCKKLIEWNYNFGAHVMCLRKCF